MKKIKTLTVLLVFALTKTNAQTSVAKKFTLNECVEQALKNNELLKTASLEIAHNVQLKKTSTELPKTSVMYTQGQFNSIYKYDNNITVSQSMPFPTVFAAQNSLARERIKGSEYKLAATKSDLLYRVKEAYYSLQYSLAIHQLLHKEDSLYESFAKAGALKYKVGEGSLLEKTTAETQVMEIKNQLLESEEDINSFQILLMTLMQTSEEVNVTEEDLTQHFLTVDTNTLASLEHPLLKYLKQEVEVSKRSKHLEASKILPDLSFGYFNQSLYGPGNVFGDNYFLSTRNRLNGFQLGMTIPLWIYPQAAKIKAAEINTELAQSNYNYNRNMLEGQYKQAVTLYLKYRNSISYYKNNALTNTQLIISQAIKSYDTGEISYIDYLQVLSRALNMERNYLNVIHQNNLAALKIEYLIEK